MQLFALPFPVIDPVAIEIGPLAVRWYALAYIAGILLGWWYMLRLARNQALYGSAPGPISNKDVDDFLLLATFALIVGGRLGFVLIYQPDYYAAHPAEILQIWRGGMSFHGGFLGFVAAVVLFARRRGVTPMALGDLCAAAVPIGLFFGRIANFVNAELWGRVSDVPWAMVFPGGGPDPRHPSQLYQAALEGIVLFLLLRLMTHRFGALRRPGLVTGVFVAGYGVARIIGEQFRQPDAGIGFLFGSVTMGMALSLPMVVIGMGLIAWARQRKPLDTTAA